MFNGLSIMSQELGLDQNRFSTLCEIPLIADIEGDNRHFPAPIPGSSCSNRLVSALAMPSSMT
jgi:hypothetical protein